MPYLVALLVITIALDIHFAAFILFLATVLAMGLPFSRASSKPSSRIPKPPSEESIARLLAVKRKQIIARHGGLLQDQVAQNHVKNVGERLTLAAGLSAGSVSFSILSCPEPRAMALPPSIVMITTGIYRTLRSESELAAIFAHEVGHIAANTWSIDCRRRANCKQHEAARCHQNRQCREYQADQLAVTYLAKAGYNRNALVSFLWRSMQNNVRSGYRHDLRDDPHSSHPSVPDRIAAINEMVKSTCDPRSPQFIAQKKSGDTP